MIQDMGAKAAFWADHLRDVLMRLATIGLCIVLGIIAGRLLDRYYEYKLELRACITEQTLIKDHAGSGN